MVHGLAQQSGGQFVLKSKKGTGTTAEMWLPVAARQPTDTTAVEPQPVPAAKIGSLSVLVVDDDPLVLTNMAAMLEDLGHTVFEAASGIDALAVLRGEKSIELMVTDFAMPHMTGKELLDEVKKEWPTLPVILATGFAELPADFDPFQVTLAKPFLQFDIAKAVETALQDPNTRRVARFRVVGPRA